MIGTSIRSVRHLHRVSDTSLKSVLINFNGHNWEICKVIKFPEQSIFSNTLIIFNNTIRQSPWNYDAITCSEEFKKYASRDDVLSYSKVISIHPSEIKALDMLFSEIVLLPETFDKDYEKFLKENSKMINNFTMSMGLNPNDVRMKRLFIYTEGSKYFFQWAVNAYFKNGISLATIKNILLWNDSYKQLAKNLSRGTITAYTSRDSIIPLINELSELRKEKRINDSINSFNTTQKKMLKENKLEDDVRQALWRLSRLSDTKRLNFIKKMSSVDDFNELVRQLKFVTSVHFSWNKDSFIDFITNVEDIKYEKVFENENVVIVKILDYETVKQLGKTTNWCISKNKQYWNNYIENYHGQTTQYMIFDFSKAEDDKLSIVGFTTTHNKGITAAHNFINDNLMGGNNNEQVLLNSFISRFKENNNIYNVLMTIGADITMFVEYDLPNYEWNRESLMSYLYECVNKENVEILKSEGDKLVLSVVDKNIKYFFGDAYHDNISSDCYTQQHIIFIDFSKNKYDANKIRFGIIDEEYYDEDICRGVFNERALNDGCNFDSLLIEFGLPYNTIRRTNNIEVRLRSALASFNTPMINDCIKGCTLSDFKRVLKNLGPECIYDLTQRSIQDYMSFDYLELFERFGMKLSDIITVDYLSDMLNTLSSSMKLVARSSQSFTHMEGITNDEIENFYNRNINNREDTKYVGYYLAIKKIIENEAKNGTNCNVICKKMFPTLDRLNKHCEVFEQFIDLVKDKLDYSSKVSIGTLARYTVYNGSQELKEFLDKKAKSSKYLKELIEHFTKEFNASKPSLKMATSNVLEYVFEEPF